MSTITLANTDVTAVKDAPHHNRFLASDHTPTRLTVQVDGVWRQLFASSDINTPPFYIIDGSRPIYISEYDVDKFGLYDLVFGTL